jgi:hypothetical protein
LTNDVGRDTNGLGGAKMNEEVLEAALIQAERAAATVVNSALREKAFEVILNRLLMPAIIREAGPETSYRADPSHVRASRQVEYPPKVEPKTLSQRILALQGDGFFKEPRGIGNVREGLRARGWHYPVTTLSGALQGLIQKRRLRRERVREGHATAWKYSNP